MKLNKHIEIVRTSKAKFSSMSVKSCTRIHAALSEHYEQVGVSTVDDLADLERLVGKRPDLVFLGLKRLPRSDDSIDEIATDIWLPEYLDQHGIQYVGGAGRAMKLDFNKEKAKAHIRRANLPTAQSFVTVPEHHTAIQNLPLPFPLFIKPLGGGGSRGIGSDSVVRTYEQFQDKVASIHRVNGSSSLVEQYLDGREFSVAIIDGHGSESPLVMPIEIITAQNSRGDRILGSTVKSQDHELVVTIDDTATRETVSVLAANAYRALGGRDFGRIDIRMDSRGNAHFLEANFMPAPSTRYFAGAFQLNTGTTFKDMLFMITERALSRNLHS